MNTLTIFQHVKEASKPFYISIEAIYNRIKAGQSRMQIEKIRGETDKKKRLELKGQLPCILFSGKFSHREDKGIQTHSGYICLDFDHKENLQEFKKEMCTDKYVCMAFVSPSGDGLKVVIKIPADIETHKFSALALAEYFKSKGVDHFADISRICFESYDPEIYYNSKSEVYKEMKKELIVKSKEINKIAETNNVVIFEGLEKWLKNKGMFYVDGNKHNFLVSIAAACNRTGIDLNTAINLTYGSYRSQASPVLLKDFEGIFNNVYQKYSYQSGIARFEKNEIVEKETKRILTLQNLEIKNLKDIISVDQIADEMRNDYIHGTAKGETTHYTEIDKCFTWNKGDLTLLHGIPGHGKSIFLMNLVLLKSIKDGNKWAIFSPEQNPPTDFYQDLIHTYIGESTDKHHSNYMTFENYNKGMDFIGEHFYYVYPEDDKFTPETINKFFLQLIKEKKITGCIIDPFNQLDHNWEDKRDDKYLSTFLQRQKRFALDNNVFMVIVAHPKGNLQKKDGEYECPNIYNLAGGAMWSNKCDNILVINRPQNIQQPFNTEAVFTSQKIKKHKRRGKPGSVKMSFDIMTNRYKIDGRSPYDLIFDLKIDSEHPDFEN